MLHGACGKIGELAFFKYSLFIQIFHRDGYRPCDFDLQLGQAQATFLLCFRLFALPDDFGIDEHDHFAFDECEAQLQRLAHLRGRQSRSVFGFHGRIHVLDELFESLGHLMHLRPLFPEDRVVSAFENGEECQIVLIVLI